MKAKVLTVSMVILALMAVPLVGHGATTLKATCAVPASQPTSLAMKRWGDTITKQTNERIKFQYFWGGALTKPGEELDAIKSGLANAGFYSVAYYPSKMVLNGVGFAVPFGPRDARLMLKMSERLVSTVPELTAEFEQNNQKLMFYIIFSSAEILSSRPVKTLTDMKGLKIAVVGSSMPKWVEAVGAVPIVMPAPDRYLALQTKLIDASLMSIGPSDPFKWHEQAKNCTLVNFGCLPVLPVTINMDDWKKLSPADQNVFMQAAKEAVQWNADKVMEDDEAVLKKWQGLGVTINTLSESDKRAWAEALKHYPYDWAAEWDKKGFAATKVLDAFFKAAEEVGYKYPVSFSKR